MTPEQLKTIRKKLNLTQSQLAKATGYTQGMISKWEGGTRTIYPRASKAIELMVHEREQWVLQSATTILSRWLPDSPEPCRNTFGKSPFGET